MAREKDPSVSAPRKRAPRKPSPSRKPDAVYPTFVDPQQRAALIARAAYYRALHRGFAPGHETADWLAAEAEVDAQLMSGSAGSPRI